MNRELNNYAWLYLAYLFNYTQYRKTQKYLLTKSMISTQQAADRKRIQQTGYHLIIRK